MSRWPVVSLFETWATHLPVVKVGSSAWVLRRWVLTARMYVLRLQLNS